MEQSKFVKYAIAAAVLSLGFAAQANALDLDGIDIELKGGTLGGGGELNYAFSPKLMAGLGYNSFSIGMSQNDGTTKFDAKFKLQTLALLGYFHPFSGVFRFSGGLMYNNNSMSMTAQPSATYDIGGTTYTLAQVGSYTTTVDFNAIAPYLGFGWGKSYGSGFGATMDFGVLFQGSPKVHISSNGLLANDPNFQASKAVAESDISNGLKAFTMYPVVSFGFNYRF